MRISKHFDRSEFACKCGCGYDTIDIETLDVLEAVRHAFGPVTVTSACRCIAHNMKVGGASRSQHIFGRACDIKALNVSPGVVFSFLTANYSGRFGFGLYDSFVHVDTRSGTPARWGQ